MIKPEFFDDPDVAELSMPARLFFIGLWTQADKEGRLVDDIRRLKARIFPFDAVDCEALAVELHGKNMIRRYSAEERHGFICIRNFTKHQRPHPKEPASVIPPCQNGVGKINCAPCKNTADPPESGSLILDPLESNGTRKPKEAIASSSADADAATRVRFLDDNYVTFCAAYPASRRVGGQVAKRAFRASGIGTPAGPSLDTVLEALESQKRSEQWQTPRLVPLMTTWLHQHRWVQMLPQATQPTRICQGRDCPHNPRCDTYQACTERILADGRAARCW